MNKKLLWLTNVIYYSRRLTINAYEIQELSNIVTASYELIFHLITMQILRYSFSKYYDCQTIQRLENRFFFRLDLSHAVEAKEEYLSVIEQYS